MVSEVSSPRPSAGLPMTPERIERSILLVRGHRVMVDADLAGLYGVDTKTLNRAVKRNRERFPPDFMFQLTPEEADNLRCQIGTSSLQIRGALAETRNPSGNARHSASQRD